MINELFIGRVGVFTNGEPDKNGLEPVIITPIFGKCPNKNVLSGTIAKNLGIEAGKTYLFSVRETDPDEVYGRKFVFLAIQELTALEIMAISKEMTRGELITVTEPVKQEGVTKL